MSDKNLKNNLTYTAMLGIIKTHYFGLYLIIGLHICCGTLIKALPYAWNC